MGEEDKRGIRVCSSSISGSSSGSSSNMGEEDGREIRIRVCWESRICGTL